MKTFTVCATLVAASLIGGTIYNRVEENNFHERILVSAQIDHDIYEIYLKLEYENSKFPSFRKNRPKKLIRLGGSTVEIESDVVSENESGSKNKSPAYPNKSKVFPETPEHLIFINFNVVEVGGYRIDLYLSKIRDDGLPLGRDRIEVRRLSDSAVITTHYGVNKRVKINVPADKMSITITPHAKLGYGVCADVTVEPMAQPTQ